MSLSKHLTAARPSKSEPCISPSTLYTGRVFGYTVKDVLVDKRWCRLPRNLDVVEMEAGIAAVTKGARMGGHRAEPYDKKIDPVRQNLLTQVGFEYALELTFRLRPGGLLGQAPQCSSWGGLNSSNTCRSKENVAGDQSYHAVADGNMMAEITWFLFSVAILRDVHNYVENPPGSMFFRFGANICPVVSLVVSSQTSGRALTSHIVKRCPFDESEFPRLNKSYKFVVDGNWFQAVPRPCACPGGEHLLLTKSEDAATPGRKRSFSGVASRLRQSEHYPDQLGEAIIKAWELAPPVDAAAEVPKSAAASPLSAVSGRPDVPAAPRSRRRRDASSPGGEDDPWAADPWGADDPWARSSPSPQRADCKEPPTRRGRVPFKAPDPWGDVEAGWEATVPAPAGKRSRLGRPGSLPAGGSARSRKREAAMDGADKADPWEASAGW